MASWLRVHRTQVLVVISLAILPLAYAVYINVSWSPLRPHEHLVQNGLAYILLILFSYVNHMVFVPRWFLTKQYPKYALVAICCVLMVVYLPYRIEQWLFFTPPPENTPLAWARQLFVEEMMLDGPERPRGVMLSNRHGPAFKSFSWPEGPPRLDRLPPLPLSKPPNNFPGPPFLLLPVKLLIFFLLGSISTLISIYVQTASRLHQVETDQLQAELRQLKAQIQPHFLFNTLNSIYALALRKDDRTADTIVKLSDFMRYIIRDAHRDQVALTKELQYITNYIDLQKARLRDSVQVNYQLEADNQRLDIAPLLLFTFIENAFKYGVNPEEESQIDIQIRIDRTRLNLYVANKKVQVSAFENSTGVGLQNAKERLRFLYPDTHQLSITNNQTDFQVSLTLMLTA